MAFVPDVAFWFKELFISYKYGEKMTFRKALNILTPYLDKKLLTMLQEIYDNSLWLNVVTGKRNQ